MIIILAFLFILTIILSLVFKKHDKILLNVFLVASTLLLILDVYFNVLVNQFPRFSITRVLRSTHIYGFLTWYILAHLLVAFIRDLKQRFKTKKSLSLVVLFLIYGILWFHLNSYELELKAVGNKNEMNQLLDLNPMNADMPEIDENEYGRLIYEMNQHDNDLYEDGTIFYRKKNNELYKIDTKLGTSERIAPDHELSIRDFRITDQYVIVIGTKPQVDECKLKGCKGVYVVTYDKENLKLIQEIKLENNGTAFDVIDHKLVLLSWIPLNTTKEFNLPSYKIDGKSYSISYDRIFYPGGRLAKSMFFILSIDLNTLNVVDQNAIITTHDSSYSISDVLFADDSIYLFDERIIDPSYRDSPYLVNRSWVRNMTLVYRISFDGEKSFIENVSFKPINYGIDDYIIRSNHLFLLPHFLEKGKNQTSIMILDEQLNIKQKIKLDEDLIRRSGYWLDTDEINKLYFRYGKNNTEDQFDYGVAQLDLSNLNAIRLSMDEPEHQEKENYYSYPFYDDTTISLEHRFDRSIGGDTKSYISISIDDEKQPISRLEVNGHIDERNELIINEENQLIGYYNDGSYYMYRTSIKDGFTRIGTINLSEEKLYKSVIKNDKVYIFTQSKLLIYSLSNFEHVDTIDY